MYVDEGKKLVKYLISTKINIGDIHLLNNGVICKVVGLTNTLGCNPCMYASYSNCTYKSFSDLEILGKGIMHEYNECYVPIRGYDIRITKILNKSLFIISKLRRSWQDTLKSEG